jgi:hypothetical protein
MDPRKIELTYSTLEHIKRARPAFGMLAVCIIQVLLEQLRPFPVQPPDNRPEGPSSYGFGAFIRPTVFLAGLIPIARDSLDGIGLAIP